MNAIILGSGGCVSTPRPCCSCPICTEARQKGFPYARTGCSLYIEDANLLIDTPEDTKQHSRTDFRKPTKTRGNICYLLLQPKNNIRPM